MRPASGRLPVLYLVLRVISNSPGSAATPIRLRETDPPFARLFESSFYHIDYCKLVKNSGDLCARLLELLCGIGILYLRLVSRIRG